MNKKKSKKQKMARFCFQPRSKTSKEKEYSNYVQEHIANVQLVWKEVRPIIIEMKILPEMSLPIMDYLIWAHDLSKGFDNEFEGYRQWFYPEKGKTKNKEQFTYAWNFHQKANAHHWEFWVMYKEGAFFALEMSTECILEMLCDWSGKSVKFGNIPSDLFEKNQYKMFLGKKTRETVKDLLPLFDVAVKTIKEKS